jgi:CheY-like chemotaxis protein
MKKPTTLNGVATFIDSTFNNKLKMNFRNAEVWHIIANKMLDGNNFHLLRDLKYADFAIFVRVSMKAPHLHILVAEDDPDDREMLIHAFSKVDPSFELHVVNDGRQVIDYLKMTADSILPALIILDYNMPQLNGVQVVETLCTDKRYNGIPKVILSTSRNPAYISDCLQKGADAYRVKPDDFQALVSIAREMVALCNKAA